VRLAPRPAFLEGRDGLLAELDARFAYAPGPGPVILVLCGLGGAGKTSVAVEYAYRRSAEFGVAWHFGAEEPAALAEGFRTLAAQLGISDLLDAGDPVALVHAMLAQRGDWLLIFDNAPKPAAVRGFLPNAGNGRVLVTSQDPHWPGAQVLEVPMLDEATAAAFLLTRTGAPSTQQAAARELAGKLGGLPLALEQAGAYIQAASLNIPEYLSLFRQRSEDLLARGDPAGYDKHVTTTWELALAQLDGDVPAAAGLLRFASCCAADDIPLNLLMRPRPALAGEFAAQVAPLLVPLLSDSLALKDAVAGLRRYSLISVPHNGLVSVHRLVQAITRAQLLPDLAADWQGAAAAVIDAALPDNPGNPADWPVFAALLPHAQAALAPTSDGIFKIAAYLRAIGDYSAALVVQRQILDACRNDLGTEHPDTLTARASYATLTGEAGDAAAARDQHAELLRDRERVLGAEHHDTLSTRASLAYWIGEAGDAAAARDQYEQLLPVMTQVLGPKDPTTLTTRSNMARIIGHLRDAAAARDQYEQLLPVMTQVLGPKDPTTLTTRASLAWWTGKAGDAAAARDQYTELVQVRRRVLGEEHPHTLTARASLAHWTGQAGDAAAARDQYHKLLRDRERVQGAAHPATLTTRNDLAYWTRQTEK
jgi:tetratricopeptide (TPR) repeat protein